MLSCALQLCATCGKHQYPDYLEMPPTEQMEGGIVQDTNIHSTCDILGGGWQKKKRIEALSAVSEWLVTVSSQIMLVLCLKCLQKNRPSKHCSLLLSLKCSSDKLFPVFYSLLTLQIFCMRQCGGVASYAEYQKTNILWCFLSVGGFGSDSAPSEASWGGSCLHMTFCFFGNLWKKYKILDKFAKNWKSYSVNPLL